MQSKGNLWMAWAVIRETYYVSNSLGVGPADRQQNQYTWTHGRGHTTLEQAYVWLDPKEIVADKDVVATTWNLPADL